MKRNGSVKNESSGVSLSDRRYPRPDEALMAPLTLRHELNDGGCSISERKLVSPISVRAGAVTAVRRRPGERAADWAHFNENAKARTLYSRARRINGHGERHQHLLLRSRDYATIIDEPDFPASK